MIKKIQFYFCLLLILFLPFQALFGEIFLKTGVSPNLVFWAMHWYEQVLLILLLLKIYEIISKKKVKLVHVVATLLIMLGLLSILLSHYDLSRGLEGVRFALIGILALLLFLGTSFSKEERGRIANLYIDLSIIVALWAILERLLPGNYWQSLGLVQEKFGFGNFLAGDSIKRSTSIFNGPNQLGSYLLPAFFILLASGKSIFENKVIKYLAAAIIAVAVILSFSRAALLGLVLGLALYLFFTLKQRRAKIYLLAAGLIIIVITYVFGSASTFLKDFINHGQSQFLHFAALEDTFRRFAAFTLLEKIFGLGLGSDGPVILKYGDGIMSESWYLQLLVEVGVAGLIVWLYLTYLLLKNLLKEKEAGVFYGFISVLITAIFLHTFADNPAIAITIYTLIGLTIHTNYEKNLN